ncbi:hypothetical protein EXN66_Car010214 [Channa argus]|uniref:Uncharacterized protein n=1 Tax=Channa argus TaxID=215402 RepID=A0A6G1PX30_CHAAH|nr:hypothetical protein EXN66_Car010214 [Channa argus]
MCGVVCSPALVKSCPVTSDADCNYCEPTWEQTVRRDKQENVLMLYNVKPKVDIS